MPERDPAAAPPAPFDQGVFLLHYNRGREAFQEGRYAEARRELESAQKLRPDDADVLNLLGLVYFKTNAFPEAEVIYRRLARENPNIFILHSNLGLILFKQGKLDDAEEFLMRSVELRPNYAKSHLYLGLLYRQRRKYGLALEHLKFAGADKLVREVENEVKQVVSSGPAAVAIAPAPKDFTTGKIPKDKFSTAKIPAVKPATKPDVKTQPAITKAPAPDLEQTLVPKPPDAQVSDAAHTAARKLQEAVDEPQMAVEKHITLERKIESGAK